MKILIAEDDAVSRRLLQTCLEQLGHEVVAAWDGGDAWRRFQEEEFHFVISDWLMPEMDGPELIRRIRACPRPAYAYTLLLTAKFRKEDLLAGMEAGADDFIAKPFDCGELRMRLRSGQRIIELKAALFRSLDELRLIRQREMETGARIQKALLQGRVPRTLPGLRVAALTLPSRDIDGDFYDFYLHHHRCLDVVIGDIMGKGVPAALLGAGLKNGFSRALSQLMISLDRDRLPDPEEIVASVHAEMTPQLVRLESFATLCYARFDLDRRHVVFVDCGHPKTIHFRERTHSNSMLQGENLPLGFSEQEIYRQVSVPFEPGDTFAFYSDGVTEMENEAGEFFGEDRIADLVNRHGELDPEDLLGRIRQAVNEFAPTQAFADDLTCIVIKIEKWPSGISQRFASR
jgi:sigma-B regulation protein RsbU (phosphoserine phosphatase)